MFYRYRKKSSQIEPKYSLLDPRNGPKRSFFLLEDTRAKHNLLILEKPKESYNVSFLGPMKFLGIGRSLIK